MTFRDDYYRSLCEYQSAYDDVIDLIMDLNPYAQSSVDTGSFKSTEEFACNAVHSCINAVLYGESKPVHCSTGGAMAVRVSTNPEMSGYHKVFVVYNGSYPSDIQEAVRAIANGTAEVRVKENA